MIYGIIGLVCDDSQDGSKLLGKIKNIFNKTEDEAAEKKKESTETETEVFPATPLGRLMKTRNQLTDIKHKMQLNLHHEQRQQKQKEKEVELESDSYFKILFYACTATILWSQVWIVFLCFIPITFYGVKELCKVLGIFTYLEDQWKTRHLPALMNWLEPRRSAVSFLKVLKSLL
jgi:hypothetical protein